MFKHILIILLILATAGAVLICTFTLMSPMKEMPQSHDGISSHFTYARELVSTTTTVTSLLSIIALFLIVISIALSLYIKLGLFLQFKILNYVKRKHSDNSYIARSTINCWLSLFEQSPNFT